MDLSLKDAQGHTDVEQIRLLGKNEIADFIESKRPEQTSRKFSVKERNADGSPILGFVKILGGSFKMGDILNTRIPLVRVTIAKPFEFMSTKTTQSMWKGVAELANQYLDGRYEINADPSKFKGEQNPVERVSYEDTAMANQFMISMGLYRNGIATE